MFKFRKNPLSSFWENRTLIPTLLPALLSHSVMVLYTRVSSFRGTKTYCHYFVNRTRPEYYNFTEQSNEHATYHNVYAVYEFCCIICLFCWWTLKIIKTIPLHLKLLNHVLVVNSFRGTSGRSLLTWTNNIVQQHQR